MLSSATAESGRRSVQGSLLALGDPEVDGSAPGSRLWLDGSAWVDVVAGWLHGADELFDRLVRGVEWRRGRRRMYDRMVDDPRLSRWYRTGDELPDPVLTTARDALRARYGVPFGAVGLNYYRDGADSVAFHRDRELRDLDDTLIAILSLGAERPFRLRPLGGGPSRLIRPASGDLLVMGGTCQVDWEHAVPKAAGAGPRISASWRWTAGPMGRFGRGESRRGGPSRTTARRAHQLSSPPREPPEQPEPESAPTPVPAPAPR